MNARLVGTLLLLAICPLHAARPQPPVRIETAIGFANLFPQDRPSPLQVDLSEAIRPIEGRLRVLVVNKLGGGTAYETPVSLATGTHKRWQFVLPPMAGNRLTVQVMERNGALLCEEEFFGVPVERDAPLVVVVQENLSDRLMLQTARDESVRTRWHVANVEPQSLPDNPAAYAGVAAILWRGENPQTLSHVQAESLRVWTAAGGVLAVAGGRVAPVARLGGLPWPARWGEVRAVAVGKLDAVLALSTRGRPQERAAVPSDATVAVRPLEGASVLLAGQDDDSLVAERGFGAGMLVQLAFDPMDLAAQGFSVPPDFWKRTLRLGEARRTSWAVLGWLLAMAQDTNHEALASLAEYRVEPVWKIAWVFGAFFGLAFCVNFLAFRKSRRYEWAWLILLTASVSLFLYNRNFGRVGGFGQTRHFEITQSYGVAGERTLLSFTEVGLLAPASRHEWIKSRNGSQLLFGHDNQSRDLVANGHEMLWPVRTRAGAFVTCSSVGAFDLPGEGILAAWDTGGDPIRLTIANKTGLPLQSPRVNFGPSQPTSQANGTYVWEVNRDRFLHVVMKMSAPAAAPQPQPANRWNPQWGRTGRVGRFSVMLPEDEPENYPAKVTDRPAFEFDFPPTAGACTVSSARQVKCHHTVTLVLPAVEIKLTNLPPRKGPL